MLGQQYWYDDGSVFGVGHSSSRNYGAHTPSPTLITKTNPTIFNIQPLNSYNFTIADSQLLGSNSNGLFESMNRATPYSPEEKKERIQRYRSKRNLRNFNKKIKYECRKTLADSRPRVRGRFARNNASSDRAKERRQYWDSPFLDDQDYSWINILDALTKSDAASADTNYFVT